MGCDIYSFAEVKIEGKWKKVEDKVFSGYGDKLTSEPFDWRSYGLFAFLAGVRNYSKIEPILEPRGLPLDSEYLNSPYKNPGMRSYWTETPVKVETNLDYINFNIDYHTESHIYLKELLDFDYNKTFEDRRTAIQTGVNSWNGTGEAEEGKGQIVTYEFFLGKGFFKELENLKTLGNPEDVRIVFYFDN